MRINRFLASGVHGYLSLDVEFYPDLTFLTGINGSGKTTVVHGISALVSPSLLTLANTTYDRMEVEVVHERNTITIWSTRDENEIVLGVSDADGSLRIPILPREAFDAVPTYRVREERIKYYREQEALSVSNPALRRVKSLPTPMLLDIDRRIEDMPEDRTLTHAVRRRSQNIFSSSLSRSLLEAAALAESSFRKVQARQRALTDQLRKNVILSAVQYESTDKSRYTFPSLGEQYLEVKKNGVRNTLLMLGLSENEVMGQLDPFFEKLKELSDRLPADKDITEMIAGEPIDTAKIAALADWMANKPQFDRIMVISRHADEYVKASQELNQPMQRYLDTVNRFLEDSGKRIAF